MEEFLNDLADGAVELINNLIQCGYQPYEANEQVIREEVLRNFDREP